MDYELICATAAGEASIARPADDGVIASPATQAVVTIASMEVVFATATEEGIVASAAKEVVFGSFAASNERVIAIVPANLEARSAAAEVEVVCRIRAIDVQYLDILKLNKTQA